MYRHDESIKAKFLRACVLNETEVVKCYLESSMPDLVHCTVCELHNIISDENLNTDDHIIGFTGLHLAAEHGNLELIEYFLRYGANINIMSNMGSPLHVAMLFNKTEAFDFLIQQGANVNVMNSNNQNAFHLLMILGVNPLWDDDDINEWIKKLFELGCYINLIDSEGLTPIAYATKFHRRTFRLYINKHNIDEN